MALCKIAASNTGCVQQTQLAEKGSLMKTYEQQEELLTVREVAQQLRVDDTTVRRWVKNGAIEAITLPHANKRQAYRIKQSTLDKILEPKSVAA